MVKAYKDATDNLCKTHNNSGEKTEKLPIGILLGR